MQYMTQRHTNFNNKKIITNIIEDFQNNKYLILTRKEESRKIWLCTAPLEKMPKTNFVIKVIIINKNYMF